MVDTFILGWGIGIIGTLVAIAGGISYVISLSTLRGEIKSSLFFICMASFIWILYSTLMIFFAFKRINITDAKWLIIPVAYTLTSIFYTIGTTKLMKMFKLIRLEENKKLEYKKPHIMIFGVF